MQMNNKLRNLEPCGHCILVKLHSEKVSKGGIVLATEYNERERQATEEAYIIKFGKEVFNQYNGGNPFNIGDLVKISKYAGTGEMKDIEEGASYRLISDADILGRYIGEELHDN